MKTGAVREEDDDLLWQQLQQKEEEEEESYDVFFFSFMTFKSYCENDTFWIHPLFTFCDENVLGVTGVYLDFISIGIIIALLI